VVVSNRGKDEERMVVRGIVVIMGLGVAEGSFSGCCLVSQRYGSGTRPRWWSEILRFTEVQVFGFLYEFESEE